MLIRSSPISDAFQAAGQGPLLSRACLVWLVPEARAAMLEELLAYIRSLEPGAELELALAVARLAHQHLYGVPPPSGQPPPVTHAAGRALPSHGRVASSSWGTRIRT